MSDALAQVRTMQAAMLVELKKPLVVDEVRLPERLSFGQVLVRVAYSGICGAQLNEIDGAKGEDKFLPHLLGHEASAVVLDVGPGVKIVTPGQRVVLHWRKGRGIEAAPAQYQWRSKPLNSGWVTTFSQYAIVSENRTTPIPDGLEMDMAPLFGCAVTTGLGVISNNAKLRIGESLVVFGAGGVGLNVVQGAVLASAYPIVAVDLYDSKLELARRLGATHTINSRHQDVRVEIPSIVGSGGADVVVDNTGQTQIIETAYELAAPQGRIICVGVPTKGRKTSIYTLPLHFGKVITGSHGGDTDPTADIPRYARLYQAGRLQLRELITDRFPLAKINEAIAKMRAGEITGRCLLEISPETGK
jgi:S-(hydroxymethyl)glutathione dehydrogenase / alcohol dehydrogenase